MAPPRHKLAGDVEAADAVAASMGAPYVGIYNHNEPVPFVWWGMPGQPALDVLKDWQRA